MLNYTSLFSDLGAFIKTADQIRAVATGANTPKPSLPALLDGINDTLNSNNTDHILEGVNALFTGLADAMAGYANQVADKCDERLLDRRSVLNELLSTNDASLEEVLTELIRDMDGQSHSVKASTVALGAATPDARNVGNGYLFATKVLDGAESPSPGMLPQLLYRGVDSQLAVPDETMTFTCTADADSDAVPEGQEVFQLEGQLPLSGPFDWRTEGSGVQLQLRTDNAHEVMANRDLEAWNDDGTPVSWTAATGVAGTDYVPDYLSANVFRGAVACKFPGSGADVRLDQPILNNLITPNRQYRLAFAWKATAAAAGTVTVEVASPSNPSLFAGNERISIVFTSSTTTSFALATTTITMPANLPDDLVFRVSNIAVDGDVWIDSLSFAPVSYANGVGFNLIAGANAFSRSDRFKLRVTNDEAVFQSFFRRKYGIQLPSNVSPSIGDSLAT